MTDREKMIEIIDTWQTEATGCKQDPEYADRLADRLIAAGFGVVKTSDFICLACDGLGYGSFGSCGICDGTGRKS